MAITAIAFCVLLALLVVGIPIAFAMMVVGFVGLVQLIGWDPAVALLTQTTLDSGRAYDLSVIPLFVLMGTFITRGRVSDDLYAASNAWLGHYRGGLAMATVVACGGFSAVSGSSLATAATMAKVAIPSMRRYGYADSLAMGSIAAGGTLGILIPPSVIMIIYGLITQTDIGQLFIAGIIPGLITIAGYLLAIAAATRVNPMIGPPGQAVRLGERFRALQGVWPILALFVIVIGGIYIGVFTPTESAGIGAFGAFLFALARKRLTRGVIFEVLAEAGRVTAMLFFVLIGALVFTTLVNVAGFPDALLSLVTGFGLSPLGVIACITVVYVVLGMVLESLSMILLTVPIFFPLIQSLGFDPIWFGVIVVVLTEVSLITPPVGMNLFVLRSIVPDVPISVICRGLIPFYVADVARLILFVLVPGTVLVLPMLMR